LSACSELQDYFYSHCFGMQRNLNTVFLFSWETCRHYICSVFLTTRKTHLLKLKMSWETGMNRQVKNLSTLLCSTDTTLRCFVTLDPETAAPIGYACQVSVSCLHVWLPGTQVKHTVKTCN
jgi:hypothetical protein